MKDPTLREFQQWMKAQILPGSVKPKTGVSLNAQRGTPGNVRMSVYAGGYITRMREALAEVFEATHHVLGEGVFIELAEAYARKYPSHDYNLSFAGRHLPQFLKDWPRTQEMPFLPDLAQLEWLICQAFHAFDQAPMNPAQLASITPDAYGRLQLFFQPSVSVVESAWPILDIWQARKVPHKAVNINLIDRPQRVLVYRRDMQVLCEPVTAAQCVLLQGLMQGRTLGEACAPLANQEEAQSLTQWFAYWMSLRLIIRCELAK